MTSVKEMIVEAANHYSPMFGKTGGYANTDGDWCMTRTPDEFKNFLEKHGFEVISCKSTATSTATSTAIAITSDGYQIAWNGYCKLV